VQESSNRVLNEVCSSRRTISVEDCCDAN
jgi:hypothetical protein